MSFDKSVLHREITLTPVDECYTGDTANGAISDNSNSDHAVMPLEPDRQTLIERLLKLQKVNAKRAEKLDFLEEHTRTLVEELQKKTKIIQNYIFHENIDAMGSNERDRHKVSFTYEIDANLH